MAAQLLVAPADTADRVVARLGAVQAQDYLGALWAIGARTTAAREADVERAIAERRFVRTWPLLSAKLKSFIEHLQERMTTSPWEVGPPP